MLLLCLLGCGDVGLKETRGTRDPDTAPPADDTAPPADDTGTPADDTGTPPPTDGDGDGSPAGVDCDDADPANTPGAPEACDGEDNDCDGAPEVDGDGACGLFVYALDADAWSRLPLDGDATGFAPLLPVEAAVGLEDVGLAWVLTAETYHVLDTDRLAWIAAGDRDDLFPEVARQEVTTALSVPGWWGDGEHADVYLLTGTGTWVYRYTLASGALELWLAQGYSADWDSDLAPSPTTVTAGWLAVEDPRGWLSGVDPEDVCGATGSLGPYFVLLTTAGQAHLYDAGYCFAFSARLPAAGWGPFTGTGAPDPSVLGATAWTGDGIIAFHR